MDWLEWLLAGELGVLVLLCIGGEIARMRYRAALRRLFTVQPSVVKTPTPLRAGPDGVLWIEPLGTSAPSADELGR